MFFIILFAIIVSGLLTAIKFPNLTSRFTSKLPKLNASRWFSNPKIKRLLQDREYVSAHSIKLLNGHLFIVAGLESAKIFNTMSPVDKQGIQTKLETSENLFELIQNGESHFLFINPKIMTVEKDRFYNSRLRFLLSRICKYRRQKYLDGMLLIPHSDTYQESKNLFSKECLTEIKINTFIFEKFDSFFRVQIPLFILGQNVSESHDRVFKNIFKHDVLNEKENLYLGFSCDVTKRKAREKISQFYHASVKKFVQAFDVKTAQIMSHTSNSLTGLNVVDSVYRVKSEIFTLTKNYLSHFFESFDKDKSTELSSITILNTILFASYEGSNTAQSIKSLFNYLATHQKDKIIFSQRFIRYRQRLNVIFSVWTALFAVSGTVLFVLLHNHLVQKKQAYIQNSIVKYEKFAKGFNANLAKRFPFAGRNTVQNVDLDTLYTVFDEFKNITSGNQGYFYLHVNKLTGRKDIDLFVYNFQNVINLLKARVDEKGAVLGAFNLGVKFKFRSPKKDEILANRIINWSISTGRFSYGSGYGDYWQTIFPWSFGDSLVLSVDLPKKSDANYNKKFLPLIPKTSLASYKVNEDSVTFSYQRDVWSLFRFIDEFDVCLDTNTSCQKGIFKFTIPLKNDSFIKFYSTIELYDENGDILIIPQFPQVAPYFKS